MYLSKSTELARSLLPQQPVGSSPRGNGGKGCLALFDLPVYNQLEIMPPAGSVHGPDSTWIFNV